MTIATCTHEEAERVLAALGHKHWRINYSQFCALLGVTEDAWAEGKWDAFQDLINAYNKLGTLAPRLAAATI